VAAADLLAELLGYEPGAVELELTDSLVRPEDQSPASGDRADLAALRAAVRAQDAGVLRARSQWLPSVAAFGNLSWHDPDIGLAGGPRRWTAGLMVRWVPFRGLADVGALRRAQADREAARARLEAGERRALAEVRQATAERAAARTAFAPLLGVRGVSMICHGNSTPRAIKNAVVAAVRAVETKMNEHIGERLGNAGSMKRSTRAAS
jgi:outer membrane protein TolC